MPLIPALRRQRQEDPCEFEARLIDRASSSATRTIQRNLVSRNRKKKANAYLLNRGVSHIYLLAMLCPSVHLPTPSFSHLHVCHLCIHPSSMHLCSSWTVCHLPISRSSICLYPSCISLSIHPPSSIYPPTNPVIISLSVCSPIVHLS